MSADNNKERFLNELEIAAVHSKLLNRVADKILNQNNENPFTYKGLKEIFEELKVSDEDGQKRINNSFLDNKAVPYLMSNQNKVIEDLDTLAEVLYQIDKDSFHDIKSIVSILTTKKKDELEKGFKEILESNDPATIDFVASDIETKFLRLGHLFSFDKQSGKYDIKTSKQPEKTTGKDFDVEHEETDDQKILKSREHNLADHPYSQGSKVSDDKKNNPLNLDDSSNDKTKTGGAPSSHNADKKSSVRNEGSPQFSGFGGQGSEPARKQQPPVNNISYSLFGGKANSDAFSNTRPNENSEKLNAFAQSTCKSIGELSKSINAGIKSLASGKDESGKEIDASTRASIKENLKSSLEDYGDKFKAAVACMQNASALNSENKTGIEDALKSAIEIDENMEKNKDTPEVKELSDEFKGMMKAFLEFLKKLFGKQRKMEDDAPSMG